MRSKTEQRRTRPEWVVPVVVALIAAAATITAAVIALWGPSSTSIQSDNSGGQTINAPSGTINIYPNTSATSESLTVRMHNISYLREIGTPICFLQGRQQPVDNGNECRFTGLAKGGNELFELRTIVPGRNDAIFSGGKFVTPGAVDVENYEPHAPHVERPSGFPSIVAVRENATSLESSWWLNASVQSNEYAPHLVRFSCAWSGGMSNASALISPLGQELMTCARLPDDLRGGVEWTITTAYDSERTTDYGRCELDLSRLRTIALCESVHAK